jgi:ABC-type nickel/cobalt efflux system permease component RcnA
LVSSFVIGSGISLKRTFGFSLTVALGHAFSAFLIVVSVFYFLQVSVSSGFDTGSMYITKIAYSIVFCIGLFMLYKKFRLHSHHHHHNGKSFLLTALAIGMVPCPGAMVLTVFALTSGAFTAGLLSVSFMAAGMALTILSVALISFYFRKFSDSFEKKSFQKFYGMVESLGIISVISFSSYMLFIF